jgi:hypothetical protein
VVVIAGIAMSVSECLAMALASTGVVTSLARSSWEMYRPIFFATGVAPAGTASPDTSGLTTIG